MTINKDNLPAPRYTDKRGAASYLDVSIRKIEALVYKGLLPASRIGTAKTSPLRIKIDDINYLMRSMLINPGSSER